MAIVPKTAYGPQTDTGDPGYPHGKARNNNVPGDGTGTPFEKDWLNDLWGFLQHLLIKGAVTPGNTPDKVGASQYYEALQKSLQTDAFTWAEPHVFSDTTEFNGSVALDGAVVVAGEVTYPTPKARKFRVPLCQFGRADPSLADSVNWVFHAPALWRIPTTFAVDTALIAHIRVPSGCTVTEVRAYVLTEAGASVKLSVGRVGYNETSLNTYDVFGAAPTQPASSSSVISTGAASLAFGENDMLEIRFDSHTTTANAASVLWVEVKYIELRATGSSG